MTASKPKGPEPWYERAWNARFALMPFYVGALVLIAGLYCSAPWEYLTGTDALVTTFLVRYGPLVAIVVAVQMIALARTRSTPTLVFLAVMLITGSAYAIGLPMVVSRSFAHDPRSGALSLIFMPIALLVLCVAFGVPWWASKLNRSQAKVESEQRSWGDIAAQFSLGETKRQNHVETAGGGVTGQLVWPKGKYTVADVMSKRDRLEGAMDLPYGTLRLMRHGKATDRIDYAAFRDDPQTEAQEWPGVPVDPATGEAIGELSCTDPTPIGRNDQGVEITLPTWKAGFGGFNILMGGDQGCLAGNTMITVNRAGNGVRRPISVVHDRWHRLAHLPHQQRWNPAIETTVEREVDGVVRRGVVKDIWQSGVKTTFTLTTESGRSIRATATHPFSTQRGWVLLGNLLVGDEVRVCGTQNSGRSKPPKRLYLQTRNLPHHPYGSAKNHDVATHRLVAEATLNKVSYDEHVARIRAGDVKGITWLDPTCHVHHRDENHRNNAPDNLVALTPVEHHRDEHDWTSHVLYKITTERVVSIVPHGEEMTYDIEIDDDPHNFLANGFVVHNSGKSGGLNLHIGHLACCADAAQVFADFKGGVELKPWAGTGLGLLTEQEQVMGFIYALEAFEKARQELLADNAFMPGRLWTPRGMPQNPGDPEQAPFVKFWIDEIAEITSNSGGRSSRDQRRVMEVLTSFVRNDRALGAAIGGATQQFGLNALADSAFRNRFNQRVCYRVGQPEEESKILGLPMTVGAAAIDPDRPGTAFIVQQGTPMTNPVRYYYFSDELVDQIAAIREFGGCELEAYTDDAMAEASDWWREQRSARRERMRAQGLYGEDADVITAVHEVEPSVRPWIAVTGPAERAADEAAGRESASANDVPVGSVFEEHARRKATEAAAAGEDLDTDTGVNPPPLTPSAALAAGLEAVRAAGPDGARAVDVAAAARRRKTWFHSTFTGTYVAEQGGDGTVAQTSAGRYVMAHALTTNGS